MNATAEPATVPSHRSSLLGILFIAVTGLALPLVWPGVFHNLLSTVASGMAGHAQLPPSLSALDVTADLLIGASYTVIASVLGYVVYQHRRILPFDWVILSFGLFIIACGFTHLMHVVVRMTPVYWLDGYIRALTAIVSVATAVALVPLVPKVAALLGAEQALAAERRKLEHSNAALQEALARAEVLATLGDALQGAVTSGAVEERALERLAPAVQAQAMLVLSLQNGAVQSSTVWGTPPAPVVTQLGDPGITLAITPVLAQVAHTGEAAYLTDYASAVPTSPLAGMAYGVEPVFARDGAVIGSVAAWRSTALGPWTAGQQDVMRRAAATISIALQRAAAAMETAQQRDALATLNRDLHRSNAELEQFAAVASHDLQAPIRTITSFSELLERRYGAQLDDRGRGYLKHIHQGGLHMKRLIDDLLEYARLSSNQGVTTEVDTRSVVADVITRLAAEGTVTSGDLPQVMGNAVQLDRLFQNLIGNGLKYRRPGVAPHVQVSAQRVGASWQFEVKDNGTGIEREYFDRIFEIFQRLTTDTAVEGTGIGLAVCKKIVDNHGGQLWVASTPGLGSTFTFTLPA